MGLVCLPRGVPWGDCGSDLDTLVAAVLGQAFYLFPWVWGSLVLILVRRGRRCYEEARGEESEAGTQSAWADRFLLCQAIFPLSVFLAVACTRSVLPHWTLVAFLSLFPLLGRKWAAEPKQWPRRLISYPRALAACGDRGLGTDQNRVPPTRGQGTLGLLKVSRDPTLDLYGWDAVGRELEQRGWLDRPNTFLFTSNWYYSGHVAFATGSTPRRSRSATVRGTHEVLPSGVSPRTGSARTGS